MLRLKGLSIGAAGAALLVGGLLLVGQVFAVSGDLSVGSASVAPGGSGTVDLTSDVGDPGLGAWTVDISYDPDVITITDCEAEEGGVCNPDFAADTVRVAGASASGVEGEAVLATISFDCADEEASTDLTLAIDTFADSTPGGPQDIDASTSNGSVDCEEQAPPPQPPIVGFGPDSDGSGLGWLIAALAVVGVAAMAGYGVLRSRIR